MIITAQAPRFLLHALLFSGLLLSFGFANGQSNDAAWELRVCADPRGYPISSQDRTGYENRIAEILAEELGARLTYEWTLISDATVQLQLKQGTCDIVLSAGEGAMGLLNTVAYQRIPNVFLYLKRSNFAAESLFDPTLTDLRIGTMPNTSMQAVLFDLGLADNYVGIQPNAARRGFERIRPTVDALLSGEIDVAIVSGALASEYVKRQPEMFGMTPVEPELVPPLTPTFYMATMGVRPQDEGLRDALNVALARRWDDIQQVFADVGVPLLDSPAIGAGGRPVEELRIGVIAPFPTGYAAELDVLAESAYFGARIADDLALRKQDRADLDFHLVYASAPTPGAALRAYDRLVAFDEVAAVVVAHDAQTTRLLAQRSVATGVPLLNALAGDSELRSSVCYANTFHVAPSDASYALALADQAILSDVKSATIVMNGSDELANLSEVVSQSLTEHQIPSTVVTVANGLVFPFSDITAATESGSEAIIVLLPPDAQGMYLGELGRQEYDGVVLGFPWPAMQTRQFYYRLLQDSPAVLTTPRVAGWDASLSADGADQLNLRFASRSALAMDVTAWSTYAAVELAVQAYVDSQSENITVVEALSGATTGGTLYKGPGLEFDLATNQLLQPLYLVRLEEDGRWSAAVSERIALASVVETIPMEVLAPEERPRSGCN